MSKRKLTKKEKYLIYNLELDIDIVKKISEIGRISGTHKYDVWIGKEVKKTNSIINRAVDIQFIIDWAKKEKPNITEISFEEASALAHEWHNQLKFNESLINKFNLDEERIIFRCKDKKHFFLLLTPEELDYEGNAMRHCVGSYKQKVISGNCLIVSLRDKNNEPHATIEIDTKTMSVVQIRGVANSILADKYNKMIIDFALHSVGYENKIDKDLMELINMNFL